MIEPRLARTQDCAQKVRLDKWLWSSRLFKTRQDAADACMGRRVRIDGRVIEKAHAPVRHGAVISFAAHGQVRVARVLRLVERRVAATEVPSVYEDLSPPPLRHGREDQSPPQMYMGASLGS